MAVGNSGSIDEQPRIDELTQRALALPKLADAQDNPILLTGVCYVYWLLSIRMRQKYPDAMRLTQPDFDPTRVNWVNGNADAYFRMVDFHGRFGGKAYTGLNDLLAQNSDCDPMYVVGHVGIPKGDIVRQETRRKILGSFWYFVYDETWDANRARKWREVRDQAILHLLKAYPRLKMVLYTRSCARWWDEQGLPRSRRLYWEIEWGVPLEHAEAVKQTLTEQEARSFHRFPTEESYNTLYDMLLSDAGRIA